MADNKNQHFVPKFYLRNFSDNGKQISVFHLDTEKFIPASPIKHEASEDYFYGKGQTIDEDLQVLETKASILVAGLLSGGDLPKPESEDHFRLLQFVSSLRFRTEYARTAHNERIHESIVTDITRRMGVDPELFNGVQIFDENAAQISVQNALLTTPVLADLRYVLLRNKTNVPLIASDNPCVLYNQFLEARRPNENNTGLVSKGLQMFCPLSPDSFILFYDGSSYRVGQGYESVIDIVRANDVEQLNLLQLVSAQTKLYFGSAIDEHYIRSFSTKNAGIRMRGRRPFKVEVIAQTRSEILELKVMPEIRTKLKLSFVALYLVALRERLRQVPVIPRSARVLEMNRFVLSEAEKLAKAAKRKG